MSQPTITALDLALLLTDGQQTRERCDWREEREEEAARLAGEDCPEYVAREELNQCR